MAGLWTAESNRNFDPSWVLRYDPTPAGTRNEDGTTSYSLNFPALQLTEWVAAPEKVAPQLATILNSHEPLLEALKAARNTFKVEYSDDGRVLSVGYDSEALRPLITALDAAILKAEGSNA